MTMTIMSTGATTILISAVLARLSGDAFAFTPQQHAGLYHRQSLTTLKTGRTFPLVPPESMGEKETDSGAEEGAAAVEILAVPPPPPTKQKLEPEMMLASAETISISSDSVVASPSDVGKEIFLANMDEMKASVEVLGSAADFDDVVDPMQDSLEGMTLTASEVDTVDDRLVTRTVPDEVEAILTASEEAVAAAEAKLLTDETTRDDVGSGSEVGGFAPPSVGKILRFAIPAIGVWLCGPLLSLIDTSSVGMLSGTSQQAALNPAVAVTDYAALLIAFLYTATTNLMAAAKENDRLVEGSPHTTKTLVGALRLSTFVGSSLGVILFAFARPLLRALIGNDSISPEVFAASMRYVRIRAIGMPAAAVIGTAQAGCLGMQDIKTPLYVLGAAAAVNFMGDMLFVPHSHAWIGGAAGAAWATTFSQYAALAFFVKWLISKPKGVEGGPKVMNVSNAILELTGKPTSVGAARRRRFRDTLKSLRFPKMKKNISHDAAEAAVSGFREEGSRKAVSKPKEESFSAKGFLHGKFRADDLVKVPSKETVADFKPYVLPVTSTQVGRVSGYVAMSHVVSSSLGTASMAAQQVLVSLFYCLCPVADSLSLTAQSFVPSIHAKGVSHERAKALRRTLSNFLKAGGVFGLVMSSAVCSIPLLSGFFTTDQAVISLVNMVAPLLVGWFAVHGIVCAAEGVLLGRKDLSFLGKMYSAYFAIVPFFMLRVKRAALAGRDGINLTSIWKVFLAYQISRFSIWGVRSFILQRRTDREAAQIALDRP